MAVKEEEKEALVPSLCVFKNGTFLNSIFLSDPEWEEENNGAKHEKILKMGRHPDCDIVVDHPSISRWHLQIQLQKSSQELLLTDLSSVHGTFVCGQRAIPKVPITLRLNDTFRLGASTRVYKFQWLPYPLEEEEDCLTPKFLHSVYEPNKHECASNGENKERDLANEGCGYTGAAGSNSWNMRCGYSDANKEQAVESTICRKLIPTLSRIVSEPHEMKYGFNNENEEQVSMEERHANAVESISRNLAPTLSDIAAEHNKQECGHNVESKELASKQKGYFRAVESIGLSNLMETPIFLENFSEPNKQKSTIFGKNKEQALKEHKHVEAVESVPNNTIKTPIYLESVSECNKGEGSFASENKDQVLKGRGNVGAVELRIPHILESVSDANKQERAFDGENKEQVLKEHGHAEVIEPVQSNPVKIPIFMESVSEPNKQECTFFDENKGETLKEHEHVETVESVPNNTIKTPIYLESVSEHNKGEGSFASENKEEALKEHGHAEAIEPVPINPVKIPIFMESVSEWKKQVFAFAAENKEQVLKEHGHVEAVESVLSNMVKTLNSLESVSQCNNGKCSFAGDNKETVLKKHGNVDVVKTVPHNPVRIPIFLDSVSEPNKQECAFAGENKEHEHVEAVESVLSNTVKTPNSLESISQCNKGECSFAGDNKEQVLKEHRKVDVVEHVPHNAVRIPIFLESVSEPNKQECAFAGENKEHEHVESVLSNTVKTPNSLESISQCNKGECSFAGDNKEQVVKEHGKVDVVEPVPHNPVRIPICLQSVSEPNKQECAFTGENKEQALKEGHVEAVTFVSINPVKSPVFLESASEIIKQECLFASESNEHALEEHKFVEAVEPNPSNPVKTPIFLESVPEPNKQECGFASENKEQFIKKHRYFGADTLVPSNLPPILSDAVLEPNKQESGFDKENMEQTSMEEGDVKVVESDARNLTQIMLDGVSEPNKQNCDIVDKNKEQFLLEMKYVELVESVPWKPVQPSAPPLPESHSHLDCFTVVTDAEMTKVHQNQILARENNVGASNLWSRRQKDGNLLCLQTGRIEMNLNPKKMKEKQVKMAKQKRILKENSSAEIILKENNVRCDKKSRVLGEKKRDCILQVLPPEISAHGSSSTVFNQEDDDLYPSDKENCTPKVSCQASKTTTRKICRVDQDTHLLQTDTGRAPFQSLSLNSRVNNRPLISSSLKSTNRSMDNHQGLHSEVQMPGRVQHPNLADSKKKWHMVVDTGCLIHNESRQALKQLEGIKGTHLIIPRIVIRELDCLKRQNKSKKGKEAQEFLRWIEECMINKGWWVHVQNSTECFSVGVTPPASPHSNLSAGSNDASTSVAFSSYGSFADVLSPTAEDHILECALLYKRLANGGRVVLLSNDVALKVKAMAEGMLCENAKEFCQSLVSPYSERFLWSQSTAHGHNWTDINNSSSRKPLGMTRKSTYFGMMRNSLLRDEEPKKKSNEGAKGLKLILLHNSHYGQKHT